MKQKSFTLIEILVVIVVIGIISSFIVVSMSNINQKATIAKINVFVNSMDNSLLLNRVSQWKLDNASGTSAFDSWLANTGTLINFADTTAGYGDTHNSGWMSQSNCVLGTCLKFDETDDYIDCGSNTSLNFSTTQGFTIGAWIKTSNKTLWQNIITKYGPTTDYYTLRIRQDNGHASIDIRDSASHEVYCQGLIDVRDDRWHNLVGVRDVSADTLKIYVDGVLENSACLDTTTDDIAPANSLVIGINGTNKFSGLIDDVRMYNQAMSSSQINQDYFFNLNNLFKNNEIVLNEFNQRLSELKNNLININNIN